MTAGSERGRVKDRLVGLTPSEVALLLACVKQIHSSTHTPSIHPPISRSIRPPLHPSTHPPSIHPPTHYWAGC